VIRLTITIIATTQQRGRKPEEQKKQQDGTLPKGEDDQIGKASKTGEGESKVKAQEHGWTASGFEVTAK